MSRKVYNLQRRRNRWYVRVVVPEPLRPIIGKTEIIRSLKTEVRKEAEERLSLERARVDALFAQARRKLGRRVEHRISEHEARQLTLLWLWEAEKRAARAPLDQAVADREWAMAQLDADEVILIDPMDEQRLGAATGEADRLLRDYGVSLEREDPMYRFLAGLLGRAMLEMTRRDQRLAQAEREGRYAEVGDPG